METQMQSHQHKHPMKSLKRISMHNQDEQIGYLKPKHCLVKPFFKNGIQQPDLGKFLSFPEN
jgi:hypothetical protein